MSDNKNDKLQKLRNKFADSFEYNEETKVLRIKDGVKNFYNIGILLYFHFEDVEEVILPTSLERISTQSFQYAKSLKKECNYLRYNCNNKWLYYIFKAV